ncbi:hypothetical protein [Kibdelosporangium phytohabitans]|uniref:Uncharacterized protein n=1 Tax=Kibdelosporangium phytohabitans TaxID=860235 RepID=A0A0N9IAQ4_9PSEU|nr:hypothetical protein [Kibdelosporangium phytohabitans]ALG13443.1 hypothetical protein AOZ06_47185 [Kibdelosporangium phytohabitans]MBE1465287.1 hypothetical protein [Kibdelosporangium phytohabitans]
MPDEDNVHEMWSDRELDNAMAVLYPEVPVNREAQVKARAQLMQAAGADETVAPEQPEDTTRQRHRRVAPLAAVAAAVAVLVVGAVVVVSTASRDEVDPAQQPGSVMPRPPATSDSQHAPMPSMPDQPQNSLNNLATRVTETPLRPGQYRYIGARGWNRQNTQGQSGTTYVYRGEYRTERWIPANQEQEWLIRNQTTGNRQWLTGTEQQARADGAVYDTKLIRPDGETRARCGHFMTPKGQTCSKQTAGNIETANGSVKPPTDPREVYKMLADGSATHADPPLQFFRSAMGLLDGHQPVAVRRATLEALSRHPYLAVADTTTSDKRAAISVSIDFADGQIRVEILLDPANGNVIGRQTTALKDVDGAKAGDVLDEEVQSVGVADAIGVPQNR